MRHTPRPPDDRVNVSDTRPLRETFALSAALLLIIVAVVLFTGVGVDFAIRFLPWQTGDGLRSDISDALVAEFGAVSESSRAQRARKLFDELVATADIDPGDLSLIVVESDQVNAMAVPGGIVVLFEGLLEEVQSENELAMILGHEIGHLRNKDHLRLIGRGVILGSLAAAVFGSTGSLDRQLLSAPATILQRSHSRARERAADDAGLTLLCAHYGHSGGATHFFARHRDDPVAPAFFASHPASSDRVDELRALATQRDCAPGEVALW